jgi:flagellar basal body-associated protein FliL
METLIQILVLGFIAGVAVYLVFSKKQAVKTGKKPSAYDNGKENYDREREQMELSLTNQIENQKNPPILKGLPWSLNQTTI